MELRIRGRVQGVWFRDTTRREADRLGVTGWIRNRGDGSVEAHVEGPRLAVEALIAHCRRGPPGARVDAVDADPCDIVGHRAFRVVGARPEGALQ